MAHGLDVDNGAPGMAYVGQKPWHGLGKELPAGQSVDVWIKAAGLDWTLDRVPVQYLSLGSYRTVDDKFVLVRSDTGQGLSIVSADYNPVQPPEVLDFYRTLVDRYGYTLETAGALDGGRKVWALARTGLSTNIGSNDGIAAYLLLATSCDKTLATTATFTSVRVVCQNTLSFAFTDLRHQRRRHIKVPHSRRFDSKEVHQELGLIEGAWEAYLSKVKRMSAYRMDHGSVMAFYERLLRLRDDKPLSLAGERERATLAAMFKSAPGQQLESAKGTLWGAVNAVTYYVDHHRKNRGGDRLSSAWFGSGDSLKDKAWRAAEQVLEK